MHNSSKEIDRMRPRETYNKSLDLKKKSAIKFFETYNKQFVNVNCPACGSEGVDFFVKYGFRHKTCDNCFTFWCSPRPTEDLLSHFYATSEAAKYWTKLLIETDNERKSLQYEPRVQHIIDLLNDDYSFDPRLAVDLGAGSGAFSLALLNKNYFDNILAVDIDEDCCKVCKSSGLKTKRGSAEDLDNKCATLIAINDMIEHLFDPITFLKVCHEKLEDNAYLSIACPNGLGFDIQIMKEQAVNITPPLHLNYFNPSSIKLLLESTGYNVVALETPGFLDAQIVERALNKGEILLENNEFIRNLYLYKDENILANFQEFLKTNLLSSHMFVLSKKVKMKN